MQVISTIGPDNATKAVLPFIAAKGAIESGETVDVFLMQEATYLASVDCNTQQIVAPGLPDVDDMIWNVKDSIDSFVVCKPCAEVRGITELIDIAEFGGAVHLAEQAQSNETTVTF